MHLLSKITCFLFCLLLTNFAAGNNLLQHEYKVDQKGKISLVKNTKDAFDLLISVFYKKEKIRYDESALPKQDYIEIKKGIMGQLIPLEDTHKGRKIRGQQINFENDRTEALKVFEFLADHTYVEWSLLNYGDAHKSRTSVYTSYRQNLEYFGAKRTYTLVNAPNITKLSHYHNHPRYDSEKFGKYAFPSYPDLKFRDYVQTKSIPHTVFKIRTDGMYIDYGNPVEWNTNQLI